MLLYLLGALTYPLLQDKPEWLLVLVTAAGAGVLLAGRRARPRWAKTAAAGLVLEELLVTSALFGTYPDGGVLLPRVFMAICGGTLALTLALGVPLPDRWLPIQGQWLRRLLAAVALLLLVTGSSWFGLWQQWWATGLPRWPLAPGLAVAALLLIHTWSSLSRGLVTLRRKDGVRIVITV